MAGTRETGTLALGSTACATEAHQADLSHVTATPDRRMADAVRALANDAVQAARSGSSAIPMRMADVATALWTRVLRYDAADPQWPDRDRFVLSAGQGSMLLYALLHLTGHAGMDVEALQGFRQLDSPAAGHPEYGDHPAIEATTGPLGQGFAAAVGMALAERMMAARFGRSLVDHRVWVIASDGDLMGGITQEAASLAAHLRLDRLTVLWDDSAPEASAAAEDTLRRFAATGWATKRVDAHQPGDILAALSLALRSKKPTLIACRMPAPPGPAAESDDPAIPRPHPFGVPPDIRERWGRAGARNTPARRAWLKRLTNHPLRAEFERVVAGRLPESWHEATAALKAELAETRPTLSTGASSDRTLDALAAAIPELVGGSADQIPCDGALCQGMVPVTAGNYAGRFVPFGLREHAMAAGLNGIALHGGLIPFGGTPFVGTDHMRPALRLAALMRQRVIHVLTDDSIGVGEDGPTHQPVEHLASLRAVPAIQVMRPADAIETVECWELAIRRADGPTLLVLSRQPVPALRTDAAENRCARGGYVLAEADGPRQATLIASGSEVAVALEARRILAEHAIPVAVVSLPCWELFAQQDASTRAQVLGSVLRVGIEAACGFGWERWLGPDGIFIGMTGFGASAPAETLFRHFGITPEGIAAAVRKRLQPPPLED